MARTRRLAGNLAVGACLALGVLMLLPSLIGLERYVISGASMSGAIERGSVAYAKEVPVGALKVGDVITYTPPPGSGPRGLVTHRIASVARDDTGRRVFRTKGDANKRADPWQFSLDRPVQARVAFRLPYAEYAFAALGLRWVRVLLIGLPAALIAAFVLLDVWREAGRDRDRALAAVQESHA